jgi:hypothetical protein
MPSLSHLVAYSEKGRLYIAVNSNLLVYESRNVALFYYT